MGSTNVRAKRSDAQVATCRGVGESVSRLGCWEREARHNVRLARVHTYKVEWRVGPSGYGVGTLGQSAHDGSVDGFKHSVALGVLVVR